MIMERRSLGSTMITKTLETIIMMTKTTGMEGNRAHHNILTTMIGPLQKKGIRETHTTGKFLSGKINMILCI